MTATCIDKMGIIRRLKKDDKEAYNLVIALQDINEIDHQLNMKLIKKLTSLARE